MCRDSFGKKFAFLSDVSLHKRLPRLRRKHDSHCGHRRGRARCAPRPQLLRWLRTLDRHTMC